MPASPLIAMPLSATTLSLVASPRFVFAGIVRLHASLANSRDFRPFLACPDVEPARTRMRPAEAIAKSSREEILRVTIVTAPIHRST
jgi:hypothetical protein